MKVLITLHIFCIFSLLELEVFINDGVESVDEGCSFVFGIFLSGVKIDLCFYFSGSAISQCWQHNWSFCFITRNRDAITKYNDVTREKSKISNRWKKKNS